MEYLEGFSRSDLLDQGRFFREVYKPVRDRFIEEVVGTGDELF